MPNELLYPEPCHHAAACHDTHHAEATEEMQRPRKITQKEADGEEIKEYPEGPRDTVVRRAAFAVHILDRHFADRCAVPRCERRNETVQFAVERNLLQDVAAICLEGRSEVVNIDAADLRHHPVGDPRRYPAHPEIVDSILAPTTDDVIPGRDLLKEHRDVVGIVLQIAIHGDDVLAARMVESSRESRGLPKVPAEFHDRNAAVD